MERVTEQPTLPVVEPVISAISVGVWPCAHSVR